MMESGWSDDWPARIVAGGGASQADAGPALLPTASVSPCRGRRPASTPAAGDAVKGAADGGDGREQLHDQSMRIADKWATHERELHVQLQRLLQVRGELTDALDQVRGSFDTQKAQRMDAALQETMQVEPAVQSQEAEAAALRREVEEEEAEMARLREAAQGLEAERAAVRQEMRELEEDIGRMRAHDAAAERERLGLAAADSARRPAAAAENDRLRRHRDQLADEVAECDARAAALRASVASGPDLAGAFSVLCDAERCVVETVPRAQYDEMQRIVDAYRALLSCGAEQRPRRRASPSATPPPPDRDIALAALEHSTSLVGLDRGLGRSDPRSIAPRRDGSPASALTRHPSPRHVTAGSPRRLPGSPRRHTVGSPRRHTVGSPRRHTHTAGSPRPRLRAGGRDTVPSPARPAHAADSALRTGASPPPRSPLPSPSDPTPPVAPRLRTADLLASLPHLAAAPNPAAGEAPARPLAPPSEPPPPQSPSDRREQRPAAEGGKAVPAALLREVHLVQFENLTVLLNDGATRQGYCLRLEPGRVATLFSKEQSAAADAPQREIPWAQLTSMESRGATGVALVHSGGAAAVVCSTAEQSAAVQAVYRALKGDRDHVPAAAVKHATIVQFSGLAISSTAEGASAQQPADSGRVRLERNFVVMFAAQREHAVRWEDLRAVSAGEAAALLSAMPRLVVTVTDARFQIACKSAAQLSALVTCMLLLCPAAPVSADLRSLGQGK